MLEKSVVCLRKVVSPPSRVFNYIGAGLLNIVVLITVAEVVLRRVFNSPLHASMELTELLTGSVVFLSLAYVALKGVHVVVDVISNKFPRRVKDSVGVAMNFISTVMCGVMSWQLFLYAITLSEDKSRSLILALPTYPFVIVGALGFLLLTLAFLIDFMSSLVEVRKQ